ncbi:hypothetical protein HGRIS_006473 [Hohenbuehelia grisea]|uniref:Nucleotidyltransferase family protein n=1 Tax=Hohenbuehelia grisea TaxID=104357 RepID=A0ABR3K020_9AGAR
MVSWSCQVAYQVYCRRSFNIYNVLLDFLSPHQILYFQELQKRTQFVISGSAALAAFDRTVFRGSDCDIYVNPANLDEIASWLLNAGYCYLTLPTPPSRYIDKYPNGVVKVISLERPAVGCAQAATHTVIQLVVCRWSPADVILKFHSTVVMNLISSDAMYCLFPRSTLVDRISYHSPDLDQAAARQKYIDVGGLCKLLPQWPTPFTANAPLVRVMSGTN